MKITEDYSLTKTSLTKMADNGLQQDFLHGLSQTPKTLPCKWFYDEIGSRLFEEITRTAEYYPTRVETRLLADVVAHLRDYIPHLDVVVEPGSGASVKTRLLLESQPNLKQYIPIDISEDFLIETANQLQYDFPALSVKPLVADFTNPMAKLKLNNAMQRMIFFPGSTIGNFSPDEAKNLLISFHHLVGDNAWLLIGVDMTQDKDKLLAAYNDATGITASFNLNLLARANRDLDANFDIKQFKHQAIFNQAKSRIEMHLVSQQSQSVSISSALFNFKANESIHTENCYKYSLEAFTNLAGECGWQMEHIWQDEEESDFGLLLLTS